MYFQKSIPRKINYKKDKSARKITTKEKCKSTSYLQSTLSQSQNPAITMKDLQWLSSKVNMLWVIYLKSLQELLGTSWDVEERSFAKSLADEGRNWWQGSGGSMRLHFLVKTTNSYDQLSTIQQAFFKATTVTKDFSKCHATVWCPLPGIDVHFLE